MDRSEALVDPLDELDDEDLAALGDAVEDVIDGGYQTIDGETYARPQTFDLLQQRINAILETRHL